MYNQFRSISVIESDVNGITKDTFEKCLGPVGLEKNLITDRIFCLFDSNKDELIDFYEFVRGLSILSKGTLQERIQASFQGYDLNGNGYISRNELRRMFKAYFHLSMELVRDVVKGMEEGMLDTFDEQDSKPISSAFSAPIISSGSPPQSKQQQNPQSQLEIEIEQDLELFVDTEFNQNYASYSKSMMNSPTLLNAKLSGHQDFQMMEAMSQKALDEMVEQTFIDANAQDKDEMTLEEYTLAVEKDVNLLAWFEALGTIF